MAFTFKPYEESEALAKQRAQLDSYNTYKESADVTKARQDLQNVQAMKPQQWQGGTYGQTVKDLANQIANRKQFSYDLNGDALYQQYKDKYINLGRMAMQDTMGQAAQLTGGYGNSYAATAGNQAYQGYLSQLNDVVPELYQMAMDRYELEGKGMRDNLAMYQGLDADEYGKYRDTVSDWNNDYDRANSNFQWNASFDRDNWANDRNYAYNVYSNQRDYDVNMWNTINDMALKEYQLALAEQNSGGGGRNYRPKEDEDKPATFEDWNNAVRKIKVTEGEQAARSFLNNAVSTGQISKENWREWAYQLGMTVQGGRL